jgi:hypothetical protein
MTSSLATPTAGTVDELPAPAVAELVPAAAAAEAFGGTTCSLTMTTSLSLSLAALRAAAAVLRLAPLREPGGMRKRTRTAPAVGLPGEDATTGAALLMLSPSLSGSPNFCICAWDTDRGVDGGAAAAHMAAC